MRMAASDVRTIVNPFTLHRVWFLDYDNEAGLYYIP